jgi:GNAT superfamily N-acetyltransferase
VEVAVRELRQDGYVEVDESEEDIFAGLGFVFHRRQHRYLLPTGVAAVEPPDGFGVISAAGSDVDRLSALDDALRQDVPGAARSRNDPAEFGRQTFTDPEFDPELYLIAVEAATGDYVGLVRVWITASGPRLGLIGVLPAYRRRGLATALLATALGVLGRRGQSEVRCEVDETDIASNALMASVAARRVGGTIEVERPY